MSNINFLEGNQLPIEKEDTVNQDEEKLLLIKTGECLKICGKENLRLIEENEKLKKIKHDMTNYLAAKDKVRDYYKWLKEVGLSEENK